MVIRPYFTEYHRHQCLFSDIRNHLCINIAFTYVAEVGFIYFYFSVQKRRF